MLALRNRTIASCGMNNSSGPTITKPTTANANSAVSRVPVVTSVERRKFTYPSSSR